MGITSDEDRRDAPWQPSIRPGYPILRIHEMGDVMRKCRERAAGGADNASVSCSRDTSLVPPSWTHSISDTQPDICSAFHRHQYKESMEPRIHHHRLSYTPTQASHVSQEPRTKHPTIRSRIRPRNKPAKAPPF